MTEPAQTEMTALLERARQGDASAVGAVFSVVYEQLREVARALRRRRGEPTLNTTALVHETYIKMSHHKSLGIRDRAHFMAVAARAMRQILIDHARGRLTAKRGSGGAAIAFEDLEAALEAGPGFTDAHAEALVALDEALSRLGSYSERQRRVVECRFFAGMSIEDTAQALGISPATVKRDWSLAQTWLYRDLKEH
jgi:RNA polymerase sigma factor (TIGR02999 family)